MLWALALWLVPTIQAKSSLARTLKFDDHEKENRGVNYCTGFVSNTQERWDEIAKASGSTNLLTLNFSTVFPSGLVVGSNTGYKLTLNSKTAIKNFLPQEGTPHALNSTSTNPTSTYGGRLAGEIVALTLNVAMDDAVASFSAPANHIGDMTIILTASPFNGLTVRQFLAAANTVLGGGASPYTPAQVSVMAKKINENFRKDNESEEDHDEDENAALLNCTPPLWASVTGVNNTCSYSTNGSATLAITSGVPPYNVTWNTTAKTNTISTLAAGTYSVVIVDGANQTVTKTVTITTPSAITADLTATDVKCFGNSTGSIATTNVNGGNGTYSYSWSNSANTASLSNLSAGSYSLTITDVKACSAVFNKTIGQPSAALSIVSTPTVVSCNGLNNGSIDVTVAGGTTPYSYTWNDNENTKDRTGLASGNYTLTVTDANLCTAGSGPQTITEPAVISATVASTNVSCFGGNSGSITLSNVAGGNGSFTYAWTGTGVSSNTSNSATDLTAGNYNYTITDLKGCTKTAQIAISQPIAALSVTGSSSNVSCFGLNNGSIDLTVTGGTTPYTLVWADNSSITNGHRTGLAPGSYTLNVTDANGCTANSGAKTITQPSAALSVSGNSTNVTCNGLSNGSIDMTVAGGTTPYSLVWADNSSITNEDRNGLAPGNYTLNVTDANGCTANGDAKTISQPATLAVTISSNLQCFTGSNGALTANVTGGTAPFAYAWTKTGVSGITTTATWSGRTTGIYNVTVTDANSCTATKTITINTPSSTTCGVFKTYTREKWYSRHTYLNANFSSVFPNGIVIGSGSNTYTFTNALAVHNFLNNDDDDDSHCTSISGNYTNPSSSNNRLAIELLVLKLNVSFDLYFTAFSPSSTHIGDLVIYETGSGSHPFNGLTLNQFLTLANNALGGVPCGSGYTLANVKNTAKHLDENFNNDDEDEDDDEDHSHNYGNLVCSCVQGKTGATSNAVENKGIVSASTMTCYPNPFSSNLAVNFTSKYASQAVVELYNAEGVRVAVLFNGNVKENGTYDVNVNTENLSSGAYFCRFTSDKETVIQKLIMIK